MHKNWYKLCDDIVAAIPLSHERYWFREYKTWPYGKNSNNTKKTGNERNFPFYPFDSKRWFLSSILFISISCLFIQIRSEYDICIGCISCNRWIYGNEPNTYTNRLNTFIHIRRKQNEEWNSIEMNVRLEAYK